MNTEELLKLRYKVIADYPGNILWVGITLTEELPDYFSFENNGKKHTTNKPNIDKYPHLFKKLESWEERKYDELPKFVKVITDKSSLNKGDIEEVTQWTNKNGKWYLNVKSRPNPMFMFDVSRFEPITKDLV